MVLKSKVVKLKDGTEITLTELSFADNLRLADEGITAQKIYRAMMSESDYDKLSQVGRADFETIREAFDELRDDGRGLDAESINNEKKSEKNGS